MKENEQIIEKSQDRLDIMKEIEKLELEGKFDVDPEKDPPTIELLPEKVDYLKTKRKNKLKTKVAYKAAEYFLDSMVKKNKLIIKEVRGIENLQKVSTGAIVTCNHFNPFDCFTVEQVFRDAGLDKDKKMFKVIREGNYTDFPGFYGFLFRNANTLPLSSNKRTMVEFMKSVDTILTRGDFILIYPEQSLWWNYKKPKPLKPGGFRFALRSNVPVIPIFITMQDSNIIGEDGFPVQEYIVNIAEPIYADKELSDKENIDFLMKKNYDIWKNIYEEFYQVPLTYTTKKEAVVNEE